MKIKRFWHFICLILAFNSFHMLFEESYEVAYENGTKAEPVQYLACKDLRDLSSEEQIDLKELRGKLYDHLNSSKVYDGGKRKNNPRRFEELILNRTKSGRYLINDGRVCLIANDQKEFSEIRDFLLATAKYFAFNQDTFDSVQLKSTEPEVDQLMVLKKEHPYSDCSKSNSRFRCLNECFKKKFRLSRYCYDGNETELIHLTSAINRSVQESEKSCFGECKRENCRIIKLIPATNFKESDVKVETFEAQARISEFDFSIQIIGLLCSFAGLCFTDCISIAIEFAKSKVKPKKVRIALFCLKLAILLLSLASFGYLCAQAVLNHHMESNNPTEKEKTRNIIKPDIVHLAICVHIREMVGSYEGKTMSEIERATDRALDDALESIHVNDLGRSFRTDYHVRSVVWFKKDHRCFSLLVHPSYPAIPSNPKLKIMFKGYSTRKLYMLSENENLNCNSFEYSGLYAFTKRIMKRSKCIDYKVKYANCTGRQNCLERCIIQKFMETYNQTTWLSLGSKNRLKDDCALIIDKNWFNETEWNTSKLISVRDEKDGKKFENICLEEIPDEKPCDEVRFEETVFFLKPELEAKEIDLQFDVVRSIQKSSWSWYSLLLSVASIQDLFFGLTVLSILQTISFFILQTISFFIKISLKANKFVAFFLYLLCSLGGCWHTYHIFELIASGELVPTEYYELAKRVQMPELVLCRPIDEKLIDRNYQLTGNYLEELTKEMTKSTFKNIDYLNESNEWISLDRLESFFLLNMKCFKIQIDREYDRDQFHFSTDTQVLRVNFTDPPQVEEERLEERMFYLMIKSKETEEFSKIVYLHYEWAFTWFPKYTVSHETSLYEYVDRFSFIRRYLHSFEDHCDLDEPLSQSNEYDLKTLSLPVESRDFEFELKDGLFEQLSWAWNQMNKKKSTNSKCQQVFITNHLGIEFSESGSDFVFNLLFLQKSVSSTNEENFGKLILALLNMLSIWYDLGVLDLHPILPLFHNYLLVYLYLHLPVFLFNQINQALLFICKWLKKFESPLFERLKARKQNSPRIPRTETNP